MNIETALSEFETAAIKNAEATETGDYRTGNKNYAIIAKVVEYLKERNALYALRHFLDHKSIGVRLWAASYLLSDTEDDAAKVLEEIAQMKGMLSFIAETTLSEWRKGNLR